MANVIKSTDDEEFVIKKDGNETYQFRYCGCDAEKEDWSYSRMKIKEQEPLCHTCNHWRDVCDKSYEDLVYGYCPDYFFKRKD